MKLELNFRVRLMLAMMLLIVVVTGATVYIAGRNLRANQDRTLEQQFHAQVRSFIALQEARSNAITEKCRALSHSVRLRAALEEHDVEDLYRNALSELLSVLEAPAGPGDEEHPTLASFFRFFDAKGELLTTQEPAAGGVGDSFLKNALAETGHALTGVNDQSIGFLAVGTGDRPQSLRAIVATKVRDWNGRNLGTLVLGFSPSEMRSANGSTGSEIKNGIWLGDRFYIEGLSASDRHAIAHHLSFDKAQRGAGNVVVDLQSGPHLLFHKPLNPESELTPAYDVCLYPLAPFLHEARVLRWKIIGLGTAILGGGLLTSLFVARNLSKPVDELAATSAENFSRRQRAEEDLLETNRELEKALRELKATQKQVIQQERLSALGQMAAGIAHDFNNALMPILGFSDVLLRNDALLSDKDEARRCLEMLRTSAQDAASVVSRLREFYRPAEADEEFPIVDLSRIIEQSVALTEPKWRGLTQARGITVSVETQFDARPIVAGDESALREVLTNLLFNAVDAMPEGGRISLQTAIEDEHAVLRVRDTGTGMTETVRQRCLEPFFSTKGDRGTGLGLSMVYGIIERHRGHLDIESAVGKGTTFIIRLPLAEETSAATGAASHAPIADSPLNVLVVDDELRSREVLTAYLKTDNHAVATASSGREALEKFKRGRFDLVVMDRAMPEMNGEQTAQFIKKVNGDVPIILLTGFSGGVEASGSDAIDVVLHKPITLETLRHTISQIVYAD
jgi:signal transduction histidine kinase